MCGLVGVAGDVLVKHEKAFKNMLVMDSLRGQHSVGVAACSRIGVDVFKRAVLPADFFTMQGFNDIMRYKQLALIGHNRYATQGAINSVNAHPFEFSDVVGAHNGTLVNQTLLPDHAMYEVDSENIFHSINHIGIEETHKKLHGAYALTYWDKVQDTLHFVRNSERPLFFTATPDKKTIFWASEEWMLIGALGRNDIKHGEIHNTKIHHLYSFDFDNIRDKGGEINLTVKKLEAYVPPKVVITGSGTGNYTKYPTGGLIKFKFKDLQPAYLHSVEGHPLEDKGVTVKGFSVPDSWANIARKKDGKIYQASIRNSYKPMKGNHTVVINEHTIQEVVEETEQKKDSTILNGRVFTKKQFIDATGGCCAWCSSPVQFDDPEVYMFKDGTGCICPSCGDFDEVKEFIQ